MTDLLLLLAPSANRVYADAAPALGVAEASAVLGGLGIEASVDVEELAGVRYLRVSSSASSDDLVPALSNLSAVFAIFERSGDLLRPVLRRAREFYPDDLVTIQKYQGKTNEQWTRLMLNVTATAARRPERWLSGEFDLMDPMCGRGTTLNIALLAGFSITGVDVDRKDFEAYQAFLKTWARTHRLKHTVTSGALTTHGTNRGRELEFVVAPDKAAYKAGETHAVRYLNADTTDLDGLLRNASVDVMITDTPYGVQHGSHGDKLARSPLGLLDRALPGWVRLLRSGGTLGLSYNRHVAPPTELADLLVEHGLELVTDVEESGFRHRVDASIDRDLMVARKP